jgi:hypothetical protein
LTIHTNKNTTGGRRSTYRDDFQEKDNVNTKEKTIADNSSYEITAQDRLSFDLVFIFRYI